MGIRKYVIVGSVFIFSAMVMVSPSSSIQTAKDTEQEALSLATEAHAL
jgi:hypothetical protein